MDGCIIEDVTEEDDSHQQQQQQQQGQQQRKQRSAADHTYDRASARWERFDADAAMRSDDSDGDQPSAAGGRSARPPQPGAGRNRSVTDASVLKAGASPTTPSAQPVLPPQRRAAKRAGAAEATTGMRHFILGLAAYVLQELQVKLSGLQICAWQAAHQPMRHHGVSSGPVPGMLTATQL